MPVGRGRQHGGRQHAGVVRRDEVHRLPRALEHAQAKLLVHVRKARIGEPADRAEAERRQIGGIQQGVIQQEQFLPSPLAQNLLPLIVTPLMWESVFSSPPREHFLADLAH